MPKLFDGEIERERGPDNVAGRHWAIPRFVFSDLLLGDAERLAKRLLS